MYRHCGLTLTLTLELLFLLLCVSTYLMLSLQIPGNNELRNLVRNAPPSYSTVHNYRTTRTPAVEGGETPGKSPGISLATVLHYSEGFCHGTISWPIRAAAAIAWRSVVADAVDLRQR